jgi:hypothetical protein
MVVVRRDKQTRLLPWTTSASAANCRQSAPDCR